MTRVTVVSFLAAFAAACSTASPTPTAPSDPLSISGGDGSVTAESVGAASCGTGTALQQKDAQNLTLHVYPTSGGNRISGACVKVYFQDSTTEYAIGTTDRSGTVTVHVPKADTQWLVDVSADGYCPVTGLMVIEHDNPVWNWIGLNPGCTALTNH